MIAMRVKTPNPKHQAPEKPQTPSLKIPPKGLVQDYSIISGGQASGHNYSTLFESKHTIGIWNLGFSLGFGVWNFEFSPDVSDCYLRSPQPNPAKTRKQR